jgi:hypothetical protein
MDIEVEHQLPVEKISATLAQMIGVNFGVFF